MDYRDIGLITRGAFDPGKLRLQEDGVYFKSTKTGKTLFVRQVDISEVEWMRVARGFELKLFTEDGRIQKFDGFKESDYGELKDYIKTSFKKELKEVDLCVRGWNWGETKFNGSLLSFVVDMKRAFEVPLKEVSQVTSGKNEVTLEFHQSEEAAQSLVEMRFHLPSGQTEGEEDAAKVFAEKCLAEADVMQAIGDAVMSFTEIQTLTPRGRYTVKPYPSFLQLHGKTFDYKIPYETVTRIFLLPHSDQKQMFFVVALDPPIRQGQTRYYFVIFLLPSEDTCDVKLTLSDEELQERYGGKLTRHMSGVLYEVFSKIMRAFVGKKITVPGSFKTNSNQCAIACSNRATSGYLYPLDKGFIFVHKPAVYIKFEAIASVNFARMTGSAGISRSFDFEIEMKDGNIVHFSSIMKEDYSRLFEFVTEKRIRVKNSKGKVQSVAYNDEGSSGSEHDPYLERMKAEGDDRDSEDEDSDFVAKESGSDDDLEFDSDAKSSGSEGEDEEEKREKEKSSRKRKKDSSKAPKPAKRAKPAKPETKGKRKVKKDPDAPKKPLSAYMLWLQNSRPAIKKKLPGATIGEIGKKAGEMWKALNPEEKSEWETESKKGWQKYQKVMAEYKATGKAPTSSASPTKGSKSKKPAKKTPAKATPPPKKYISAEYVGSNDDVSSDGEEEPSKPARAPPAPAAKPPSKRGKGKSEGLTSLPSDVEESEEDAESTGSEEDSVESD